MPRIGKRIAIIIVSYNCRDKLKACLGSLIQSDDDYQIIVVDNGSSDGSAMMIEKDFPGVKLIDSKVNLGFAKANNVGFNEVDRELILFLNPDTFVVAGSISKLAGELDNLLNTGVHMVGPRLLFPNGEPQPSAHRRFPDLISHTIHYNFMLFSIIQKLFPGWDRSLINPIPNEVTIVKHLMGAALLTSSKAFKRAGQFDERFFCTWKKQTYALHTKK
jgi:GT2 family glycosyltransferase